MNGGWVVANCVLTCCNFFAKFLKRVRTRREKIKIRIAILIKNIAKKNNFNDLTSDKLA